MSKKSKYVLSESTLAIVGLYDETYALYSELREIYQHTYSGFYDANPKERLLWPSSWDGISRPHVRRAIDQYLVRNTFLFTTEYKTIRSNTSTLLAFSMLDVKRPKPLTLSMKRIPFSAFLIELEMLVYRILLNRKRRTLPKISGSRVITELQQHIEAVFEHYRSMVRESPKDSEEIIESELIIFESLSLISCNQQKHTVSSAKYSVELLDGTGYIALPVHCCQTCGRIFIGRKTFDIYQNIFGRFFVKLRNEKTNFLDADAVAGFKFESELHSMGYNVIQGEMSTEERRTLLIYFMAKNKLTYFQICRDIERCLRIFTNSPKHAVAVEKWKSDLVFLGELIRNK